MSEFRDAVKQLAMPMCPRCQEMRAIEPVNLAWFCQICSYSWLAVNQAEEFLRFRRRAADGTAA